MLGKLLKKSDLKDKSMLNYISKNLQAKMSKYQKEGCLYQKIPNEKKLGKYAKFFKDKYKERDS